MSQENVEIVRDSLRAFEEGGLDAMAETWTADVNWRAMEGALDDVGEMHGREALLHYYEDWLGTFDDISVVLEEVLDVGDDRAVAVVHVTARAKASGVRTELRYAVAYTVRDGKIARGREYIDREHALAAAGLRQQMMSQENVELVRSCVDALNKRDVNGYLACCVEHVELVPATAAIEGTYMGRSGIRRFFSDVAGSAPDFSLAIERLESVGPGRILCFERGTGSGRTSGASLEEGIPFGTIYDFADGKIERIQVFTDRQQAREAAGLREQAMSQENVRLVREAFESSGAEGLRETAEAYWHPEVEYVEDPRWPGASSYKGRAAVLRCFGGYMEALGVEDLGITVERVLDGGARQVALVRVHTRGASSGVQQEHLWGYVVEVYEGLISYFRAYYEPAEALDAAGLRDQAMSQKNQIVSMRRLSSAPAIAGAMVRAECVLEIGVPERGVPMPVVAHMICQSCRTPCEETAPAHRVSATFCPCGGLRQVVRVVRHPHVEASTSSVELERNVKPGRPTRR